MTEIVNVLAVKNDPYPIDLHLISTKPIVDRYIIYDSSTDITSEIIRKTVREHELDAVIIREDIDFSDAWLEGFRKAQKRADFILKGESDNIFSNEGIKLVRKYARKASTVTGLMYRIPYAFRLANKSSSLQTHERILYAADVEFIQAPNITNPMYAGYNPVRIHKIIGVNLNIKTPWMQFLKYHRRWWFRDDIEIPEWLQVPSPRPYCKYMTLEEYVERLYASGKGLKLEGKTLLEKARRYVRKMITERNLILTPIPKGEPLAKEDYPELLRAVLDSPEDPRTWDDDTLNNYFVRKGLTW